MAVYYNKLHKRKRLTKEELDKLTKEQLKEGLVDVIAESMMPIIKTCIAQRISQWFDVIEDNLQQHPTKQEKDDE